MYTTLEVSNQHNNKDANYVFKDKGGLFSSTFDNLTPDGISHVEYMTTDAKSYVFYNDNDGNTII
jgi:hypothetical protein